MTVAGQQLTGDVSDPRNRKLSGQFVKDGSGHARAAAETARRLRPAIGATNYALFLEEMNRQVAVREGETVERTSVMRAAAQAIALKAAKRAT